MSTLAHGHGRAGKRTPIYYSWSSMRSRCGNPNSPDYARYGGRGIKCCVRWSRFENFLADMGERPEGKTLDRIDNAGHYEPGNCRWATPLEQTSNTSANKNVTFGGETLSISAWARRLGMSHQTLATRLKLWPIEKAMTKPPNGNTRQVTIGDVTRSVSEWCRKTGISRKTVNQRLKNGWPEERAILKEPQ